MSEFSYLFPQEQLVPIVGHEVTPYLATRILSTMVSTRSRAEVKKQPKAGPTAPFNITLDLAAILEGQVKMQQELANLRKHSADEMEALKQENSRLRRKIEVDPTPGKTKESSEAPKSSAYQPSEEESEYNPTPHTFTTTQQTPIISTHHTNIHPTIPIHTATPTPLPPFPLPIYHLITSPLLSLPSSITPFDHTRCHPNHPSVATLSLMLSPTPFSLPNGNPSH